MLVLFLSLACKLTDLLNYFFRKFHILAILVEYYFHIYRIYMENATILPVKFEE